MRELGEKLFESDCDVKAVLLPGHGTTWQDLEKTTWPMWYAAVEREFLELKKSYAEVFIAGQSMGGCLALYLSTFHAVDGIITIASGTKIFNRILFFIPFMKFFKRYQKKHNGPDIKNRDAGKLEVHYHEMPLRSIEQLQKLLHALRQRIHKVECPLLHMHGREDHTFAYRNMEMILNGVQSKNKRGISLENTYHLATLDYDKAIVQQETLAFVKSNSKLTANYG